MREHARELLSYLCQNGYNTAQETAADLGLDQIEFEAAIDEIHADGLYDVLKGLRPDSYGREVIWIKRSLSTPNTMGYIGSQLHGTAIFVMVNIDHDGHIEAVHRDLYPSVDQKTPVFSEPDSATAWARKHFNCK